MVRELTGDGLVMVMVLHSAGGSHVLCSGVLVCVLLHGGEGHDAWANGQATSPDAIGGWCVDVRRWVAALLNADFPSVTATHSSQPAPAAVYQEKYVTK